MILLLLMLALQHTMGFSLLGDFLPFHPFLTQFSPPSYSHRLDVFLNIFYPFFLGLPLILLPIGFHSNILLGILPPSIRVTCPSQATLLLFIILTTSAFPISLFSSWFFLILQIPFSSCTGPKIFLIFSAQIFLIVVHFDLPIALIHQEISLVLISVTVWVNRIGNRSRDLPACSAVPQLTTPPCGPYMYLVYVTAL